jgi:hypothetical protein
MSGDLNLGKREVEPGKAKRAISRLGDVAGLGFDKRAWDNEFVVV